MYPFKFKLGDSVRICAGMNIGTVGVVSALELSPKRTIAIITRQRDGRPVREVESNIQLASSAGVK